MADRELLERLDAHMARSNEYMARGNELMEQLREEHRLNREEHRLNRAFMANTGKVLRELVLEVRENREALKDIRHGIQAETEGLMRVLDELGLGQDLDVVSVFNLVHHLPEERDRELCRMARDALKPGGVLVVGDSERPGPGEPVSQHGALSSLLFYAWSHGRNFNRREIASWLEEAGFDGVEVHRNERSPWRIVVTGRAPG